MGAFPSLAYPFFYYPALQMTDVGCVISMSLRRLFHMKETHTSNQIMTTLTRYIYVIKRCMSHTGMCARIQNNFNPVYHASHLNSNALLFLTGLWAQMPLIENKIGRNVLWVWTLHHISCSPLLQPHAQRDCGFF